MLLAKDCSLIVQSFPKAFETSGRNQLWVFLSESRQTGPDGFCWELHPQPGVMQLNWVLNSFSSQMLMRTHISGGHIAQWIYFMSIWKNMALCSYLYWLYWLLRNSSTTSDVWSLKVDQIEWAFFSNVENFWQQQKQQQQAASPAHHWQISEEEEQKHCSNYTPVIEKGVQILHDNLLLI